MLLIIESLLNLITVVHSRNCGMRCIPPVQNHSELFKSLSQYMEYLDLVKP